MTPWYAAGFAACLLVAQAMTPPKRIVPPPEGEKATGPIPRFAAEGDASTFARAIAAAGKPAGFIMPLSERQPSYLPPDTGEGLSLEAALQRFTARNPRYTATRAGSALVVRHDDVPAEVMRALELSRSWPARTQRLSELIFGTVLRTLARSPVGAPVGSAPQPGDGCPAEKRITLPAAKGSIIERLNAASAAAPGLSWLVRFGRQADRLRLQVGYVCGDGIWSAMSVPGW